MKKKTLVLVISLIIILVGGIVIYLINNKVDYQILVSIVDNQSPDRVLKVVKKDSDENIDVEAVYYMDDVFLCSGENLTVNKFDIKNEEKLYVVLKNGEKVKAIVVMED